MRIVVVHPEDSPDRGPWTGERWERVIDLAQGGFDSCERWSRRYGCPVLPLNSFRRGAQDFRRVREFLFAAKDQLHDRMGLDWWPLLAILLHAQVEGLASLRRFAAEIGPRDSVFITRPGFHADALRLLLGDRLQVFPDRGAAFRGLRHYCQLAVRFPLSQLRDIFFDKYDASYQLRRMLSRRREPATGPLVLLPSAYVNVSRLGYAYARLLPETRFLLVATRRSGWVADHPANVSLARLASYAPRATTSQHEASELIAEWRTLRRELEKVPEIELLSRLGLLDSFPRLLRQGLVVRDAWRTVLEREPVDAVFCGDDTNSYTHIPLLLARKRGLPTVACHHGALDGRYLFKRIYADVILAKGNMERDYLVRVCGLPESRVELGAPEASAVRDHGRSRADGAAPLITFFSEPYDTFGGRTEEFYRDTLPRLADLARDSGRRLIIKLHPFENLKDRTMLIKRVLSPEQRRLATVMTGRISDKLLQQTWFGVTVLSTVAMECTTVGVPCFLCGWLDYSPYGYIDQFSRFGVGQVLHSPAEIAGIPRALENYAFDPKVARELWDPIAPERLKQLFSKVETTAASVAV